MESEWDRGSWPPIEPDFNDSYSNLLRSEEKFLPKNENEKNERTKQNPNSRNTSE